MPCASTTLSSTCCWSSQPSSYDMPEHPPPTTRIRRPHSGLPSSRRSSDTFLAAVSLIVIIRSSRKTRDFSGPTPALIVSQDATRGHERELFQRRVRRQRHHEDGGARNVLRPQHLVPRRRGAHGVP